MIPLFSISFWAYWDIFYHIMYIESYPRDMDVSITDLIKNISEKLVAIWRIVFNHTLLVNLFLDI